MGTLGPRAFTGHLHCLSLTDGEELGTSAKNLGDTRVSVVPDVPGEEARTSGRNSMEAEMIEDSGGRVGVQR